MQFSRDGDWYQVIRITGPARNLLALKFGDFVVGEPEIERLCISNEAPLIEVRDVQSQVLEGLADVNGELGTKYRVTAIRFVTTDSPSSSVYRSLAKIIVERMSEGGTFAAA